MNSKILLDVEGKNINRFIKKLRSNKIDVLKIKYKNKNEASVVIKKSDYSKVKKIKSIYDINVAEVFGFLKIKRKMIRGKYLIIFSMLAFLLFITLTNTVFDIEVVHSNKEIRTIVMNELSKNGIRKYSAKKNYNQIQMIKEKILSKYPNRIEWIEIEEMGTKYIVRVEERKIPGEKINNTPRNIVAMKEGIIKKVIANKGEIIRDMDDFVQKGELIISGDLIFNNEVKGKVRAEGKVYAEIWYLTKVRYPFVIDKNEFTGREKDVLTVKFLNRKFEFTFNKFKQKKIKEKEIFSHRFLPIKLVLEKQKEKRIVNQILTYDEALECAKKASEREIKSKLKKDEYIIKSTYLKSSVNNSTIDVEMFFSVYEDITDYVEIGE